MFRTISGKELYRIGDVIISTNTENPSANFGGTWQLLCPGRTLVCIDTSDSDFNSVKKTGGNKNLQSHNHSASSGNQNANHYHYLSLGTSSAGTHNHKLKGYEKALATGSTAYRVGGGGVAQGTADIVVADGAHSHSVSGNTGNNSGNHTHSISVGSTGSGNSQNLQPYIVVYIWVRTA